MNHRRTREYNAERRPKCRASTDPHESRREWAFALPPRTSRAALFRTRCEEAMRGVVRRLSALRRSAAHQSNLISSTIHVARVAHIAAHGDLYASLIGDMSDADFRTEIEMFGNKTTRGAFIVNLVLCGCAAYRTQLFMNLKACGREELSTMNLWAGMDAPVPA